MSRLPLHEIAHGRTGDKGNRLNISVIAYADALWPLILDQVTAERVHDLFRHRGASRVVRYVVPNLKALNFVIDDVLEGGVNSSLNIDVHGKTNSFRLLGLAVEVPEEIVPRLPELRRPERIPLATEGAAETRMSGGELASGGIR